MARLIARLYEETGPYTCRMYEIVEGKAEELTNCDWVLKTPDGRYKGIRERLVEKRSLEKDKTLSILSRILRYMGLASTVACFFVCPLSVAGLVASVTIPCFFIGEYLDRLTRVEKLPTVEEFLSKYGYTFRDEYFDLKDWLEGTRDYKPLPFEIRARKRVSVIVESLKNSNRNP